MQNIELNPADELQQIAGNIDTFREDLGWSKAQLLRRCPELGTDKTFSKALSGDTADLKVEEKWLPQYKAIWGQLQSEDLTATETLVTTMRGPMELCRAYLETRNETGNARFILVLGDTAMGKTKSVEVMKSKPYGQLVISVEASDAWAGRGRGTAAPLLRGIAEALGMKDLPNTKDGLLNAVVAKLRGVRRCLIIEEVHHLCPQGLNTIKTLINLSPVIIIATALPVLWDRLEGSRHAWAECRQLTGNRLAERITLTLSEVDVDAFLANRLPDMDSGLRAECATLLTAAARTHGNLQFVNAVAKRFRKETARDQPATKEVFKNAIAIEQKRR